MARIRGNEKNLTLSSLESQRLEIKKNNTKKESKNIDSRERAFKKFFP